jgi:hypothetical protein
VDPAAVGLTVGCPRCGRPFVAAAEPEPPEPEPAAPPPAPRRRGPLAPPPEPDDVEPPEPAAPPEEDHDPHRDPPGGPASVLVGLALLPFGIPILWLIAPAVVGREPVVSAATPAALAVAAAALCLAMIYTVDWTPGTRVRGVLAVVGLSYVAGAGLYVVTKDTVAKVRRALGADPAWDEFKPPGAGYAVKLPTVPLPLADPPPLGLDPLACFRTTDRGLGLFGRTHFTVGSGAARPGAGPAPGTDAWFDQAAREFADRAGGPLVAAPQVVTHLGLFPGRELRARLPDKSVRVARVFVVPKVGEARVFYLAVEGPRPDPDAVARFFESFALAD